MAVIVGSARIDENGKATGGAAGDQNNGKEVSTQNWYLHTKGWRVFRAKDPEKAAKIAYAMKAACDNSKIGYDQNQRNTLYTQASKVGFDPSKVTTACETDCSALVRVCCAYAGITDIPSSFRTSNLRKYLLDTGEFVELDDDKYTKQSAYLGAGDILCTRSQGHTVVVLSNGSKYDGTVEVKEQQLGERTLSRGMDGADVKQLQTYLIELGYSMPKYGADGDFGSETETALKKFQQDYKLTVNGEYDSGSHAALLAALNKEPEKETAANFNMVTITGSTVNIRKGPDKSYGVFRIARKGDTFERVESIDGWIPIVINNAVYWVSDTYVK